MFAIEDKVFGVVIRDVGKVSCLGALVLRVREVAMVTCGEGVGVLTGEAPECGVGYHLVVGKSTHDPA